MRRLGAWKLETALLMGLSITVPAMAAEPDGDTKPAVQTSGNWFSRLFSRPDKPDSKKSNVPPEKNSVRKPLTMIDQAESLRARELDNYLRRLAVCDQLRQVAYDTQDEDLQNQVIQLEERVWQTYWQRTSQLPPSVNPGQQADERILEEHLGNAVARTRSTEGLTGGARDQGVPARTSAREEKDR